MVRIRLHSLLLKLGCLVVLWSVAAQLCHAGNAVSGDQSIRMGGRKHQLWVPAGYTPEEPRPLIVALHGCKQSPAQFAGLTRLNQLADAQKLLVVYPKQSLRANLFRCWNWSYPRNQTRGWGEPELIMDIVARVQASYAVDASRIYVVGASAGGVMASILMSCYSDVFAAAVVASGGMYKAADNRIDARRVGSNGSDYSPRERGREAWQCSGSASRRLAPVLVFHGSEDNVAAPVNGEQVIEQFIETNDLGDDGEENNSVGNLATSTRAEVAPGGLRYTIRNYAHHGELLLQYYFVEGMGHAWSGGDPAFAFSEPRGPDATTLMWEFLKQHKR
jgi:poly(hydroxyalkanoate) depolymerase family esterase